MIQDLYIAAGVAYVDAQRQHTAADAGLRIAYGDRCDVTLHFTEGILASGDTVMCAFDSDMLFGAAGTSPMGKAAHTVTAEDAAAQTVAMALPTNTERFYGAVNGARVPIAIYFGIYLFKEGEQQEGYPQITLALVPMAALPVVALLSDTVVPIEPADIYYTKDEVDASFVANAEKGIANGVATLDSSGKVPAAELPAMDYLPLTGGTLTGSLTVSGNNNSITLKGTSSSLYLYQTGNIRGGYGVSISGTYGCLGIGYNVQKGQTAHPGRGGAGIGDNIYVHENTQLVHGKYNTTKSGARIVGGGSGDNARKNIEELSWSGNHYIAGGQQQSITTIPAATSEYTLSEGVFKHTPDTAPTYTLPAISDASRTHTIVIAVDFATAASVAFQDTAGTTIAQLPSASTIAQGKVFAFLCTYQALLSKWVIMPVDLEAE